jgi:hypothetical protein
MTGEYIRNKIRIHEYRLRGRGSKVINVLCRIMDLANESLLKLNEK